MAFYGNWYYLFACTLGSTANIEVQSLGSGFFDNLIARIYNKLMTCVGVGPTMWNVSSILTVRVMTRKQEKLLWMAELVMIYGYTEKHAAEIVGYRGGSLTRLLNNLWQEVSYLDECSKILKEINRKESKNRIRDDIYVHNPKYGDMLALGFKNG